MQLSASDIIIVIPVLLVSMILHEMAHAIAGYKLGDDTAYQQGRISLNPLAHIDPFMTIILPILTYVVFKVPLLAAKPVPFNPDRVKYEEFGAAIIGVAGPLTNLSLACLAAVCIRAINLPTLVFDILYIFTAINVALFVFNMIPFPPLDGSRLLYAFAPEPLQKLMQSIESLGFAAILIIFLVLINILGPVLIHANQAILHLLLGPHY